MLYLKPTLKLFILTTENSQIVVTTFGNVAVNFVLFNCFWTLSCQKNKRKLCIVVVGNTEHTLLVQTWAGITAFHNRWHNPAPVEKCFHTGTLEKHAKVSHRLQEKPANLILFEKSACDITFTVLGGTLFPVQDKLLHPTAKCRNIWRMQAGIETHLCFYIDILNLKQAPWGQRLFFFFAGVGSVLLTDLSQAPRTVPGTYLLNKWWLRMTILSSSVRRYCSWM